MVLILLACLALIGLILMCGRYVIYDNLTKRGANLLGHAIPANFNVAPTTNAPIIRLDSDTNQQELLNARWGLVPNWAKDLKIPPFFNARADNLKGNKVFWPSIHQRCIVPMSGFYEWAQDDKQPYYIHLESKELFYTAGIWNKWQPKEGEAINSFSIITTKPNKTLADIHHRMPVILQDECIEQWLNEPYDQVQDLVKPSTQPMAKYKVDPKQVNKASNNSIKCLAPVP